MLNGCTFIKYFQSSHDNDYAAWSDRPVANSWTPISENSVKLVGLYSQSPNDIQMFCPNYSALKEKGIGTNYGAQCLPFQHFYQKKYELDCKKLFPNALQAFQAGLALPMYDTLKIEEVDYVVKCLIEILDR